MATYEHVSFWQEEIGLTVSREPLTENISTDVCIIGAGFTGLSTAIHLKEMNPELNVTVLESDFVGYGASGRNAGFSMRLFGISMEITQLLHGKQKTKAADDYLIDAVQYVEQMIDKYNIDCHYERTGMITVASNPQELKQLRKEVAVAAELELPGLKWMDDILTKRYIHSPYYLASRHDEYAALLHPAKLVTALADIAEKLGVKIYEQSKVVDLRVKERLAITEVAAVKSNKLAIATNASLHFTRHYISDKFQFIRISF